MFVLLLNLRRVQFVLSVPLSFLLALLLSQKVHHCPLDFLWSRGEIWEKNFVHLLQNVIRITLHFQINRIILGIFYFTPLWKFTQFSRSSLRVIPVFNGASVGCVGNPE